MVARQLTHIGHSLACHLHHQSHDPRLATIFLSLYIIKLAQGLGLINGYADMRRVGGIQPLRVTMLRVMPMIECEDTLHGVQYWVVYMTDSESSNDEECLPETTITAIPLIPAPAPITAATAAPPPSTVTLTSSIQPAIEECMTHLEKDQVRLRDSSNRSWCI